ncbi:hypothetical protein RSAG8_08522, partial [Rhizoctonia solani AG-8 WAC10335]
MCRYRPSTLPYSTFGLPTRFSFLKSHPPSPSAIISTYRYASTLYGCIDGMAHPPASAARVWVPQTLSVRYTPDPA